MIDKNIQKRIEKLIDRGSKHPAYFQEDARVISRVKAIEIAEMAVEEAERKRQEPIDEDPFEQIPNQ